MKKERPPCEGGPPQQNIAPTLPLGVNGSGVYFSAVTASTLAIEAPANLQAYSPGTSGHHEPAKPQKDYRLSWTGELSCLNFKGKKTGGMLTKLVLRIQHNSTDGLMCIGKGELAELVGVSKRTADRNMRELIALGCIRLVRKGGSLRGQKRDANWYALGDRFNGTPPPARLKNRKTLRPVSPVTLVPPARPVSSVTADQCHALHPLPNNNTNTHTKESSSAFNMETWKTRCLELNPQRHPGDIDRTYYYAIAQGARDGHWEHLCRRCDSHYKPPTKPQASAAIIAKRQFTPAHQRAVRSSCESRPTSGEWFDGLSKEEWHAKESGWYGLGGRDNWIKAGCPHLAGMPHAERELVVATLIAQRSFSVGEKLKEK